MACCIHARLMPHSSCFGFNLAGLLDFEAFFFPVWLDSKEGFLELLAFAIVCVQQCDGWGEACNKKIIFVIMIIYLLMTNRVKKQRRLKTIQKQLWSSFHISKNRPLIFGNLEVAGFKNVLKTDQKTGKKPQRKSPYWKLHKKVHVTGRDIALCAGHHRCITGYTFIGGPCNARRSATKSSLLFILSKRDYAFPLAVSSRRPFVMKRRRSVASHNIYGEPSSPIVNFQAIINASSLPPHGR